MVDDLSAPLGKKKFKPKLPKITIDFARLPMGRILAGLLVLVIVVPVARIILVDDPDGGRPFAQAPISVDIDTNRLAGEVSLPPDSTPQIAPDIVIAEAPPDGPEITTIDDSTFADATDATLLEHQRNDFGVFADLSEQTQYGVVPRISTAGQTPFSAYARPSIGPEAAGGRPLLAIVVTGMGLNQASTLDAIAELPDNITLAFAPQGRSLLETAAAARAGGHELLLEVPMEPFDYPNSDPGPHTLLTNQPARANLDHLTWVMAQMGGYVGLINYQGARFTASANDLGPIMEELGTRGIGFVDDGSSNRSLTSQLAQANGVPYARAVGRLDANPSRAAILEALRQLEDEATRSGSALGVVSALPVSISTLKSWAASLEDRQIELVPASVVMKSGSQ